MNAERLLDVYEQISEAPGAVARLRRFVLDLAVRGKLVEPISAEGTGTQLARSIAADKAAQERVGLITPAKAPKGATRDTALEIPSHWQSLLMVDILDELQTGPFGSSLKKSDYAVGGVPVINPASIVNETIRPVAEMAVGAKTLERLASFKLQHGDIVMARRGEMGRCALVGETEAGWLCGTGSLILRPSKLLFAQYLVLLIGSPYSRNYLAGSAVGATMQNLNQNILLSMPIGLPPEPEQHRIVAKVDELMALCDRLEEARKTREEVRDKLTAASLARLTAPDTTAEDFPTHTAFALEALPALTTRPDQIKSLRQTILNLAVRGKLVQQDAADAPPSVSLDKIQAARNAMIAAKKLRKESPLAAIPSEDVPFSIPKNWEWVRVGELALFTQYGTSAKAAVSDAGVPVLTMGNIQDGRVIRKNEKRISDKSDELPSLYLRNFDLLYNRTNSAELVGKTGIYIGDDDMLTFASYLIRVRLHLDATSPFFINLVMNAPDFRETQIVPHIKQQTGQANVSGSALKNMLIPLPPLTEQHRIVAKVDALMALCDRLEAGLTTTDITRTRLLEALLHEALDPATDILEAAE